MTETRPDTSSTELDETHRAWLDGENGGSYPAEVEQFPELHAGSDAMDAHMARLENLEPLPASEQEELARRYCDEDDQKAGQLLVMTNLRFVISIAQEYTGGQKDAFEFVQEGNVGLSKALDQYNPDRAANFTSYAQFWIRARILDYLIDRKRTIRLDASRAARKLFYNLHEVRKTLREAGVEPTPERIADALDVPVEEVIRVGNQMEGGLLSLDKEVGKNTTRTYADAMESDVANPEELAADREAREIFREAIEAFEDRLEDERRRSIWKDRVLAVEPRLLRELGADWRVSKERIRQIESDLLGDFRAFFRKRVGGRSEMQRLIA